jgi:hypothetical protein
MTPLRFPPHKFVRPAYLLLLIRGIRKNGILLTANGMRFISIMVEIAYTAFLLLFITRKHISFAGMQTCKLTPSVTGRASEF